MEHRSFFFFILLLPLLLVILSWSAVCEGNRILYNTDFTWKFHLGEVPPAQATDLCPANAFPTDLTGYSCVGWAHQAAYELTEDECRLYCCSDPNCAGYLFNWGFCSIGNNLEGCVKAGMPSTGGARPVPAQIPAPPPNGPQTPSFDDSQWSTVDVPHDYIVFQTPSPLDEWNHGYRPKNVSWYRKHFTLDQDFANQLIWLEFDGVYRSSDMWLNGHFLGHHSSGYTSFRYRLDNQPSLKIGTPNVLSVRIDPRGNEGWWYEGAGIYRHTRIVRTNFVHFSPYGIYVPSQVVGVINNYSADSVVEIFSNVTNDLTTTSPKIMVTSTIFGPLPLMKPVWSEVSEVSVLDPAQSAIFYQKGVLLGASLWDISSPSLYLLQSTIVDSVTLQVLDNITTTFGIRKIQFDSLQGFFLNDKNIKVKGMCNHQDFAAVGTAVPERINRFKIEKQQSLGVNAWRMSHNPPNPELLDWTDRLGMMVWDENRFFGNFSQWFVDFTDMILRDRNHPSIIWWSLCNEWGCQQHDIDVTVAVGVQYREILKTLDPTRPISGAWDGDLKTGEVWGTKVCDIMGINYNYKNYDPFHKDHPTIPLISSESCSCTSDRSSYIDKDSAIVGPYHAWSCLRDCWSPVISRDFVMGSFDWTGFDYRGEETPTVWPAINSHFGIIDLSGFNKDAAYYYQAQFNPSQPVVHIVPRDWNDPPITLVAVDCESSFQWKFSPSSPTGSTIESVTFPGHCVQGTNGFPATTVPCNPTDPTQTFYYDNYRQIYYLTNGSSLCLDLFSGTGPTVGFYPCKNSSGSNQDWTYSNMQFKNALVPNDCLASAVEVRVYTNGDSVDLYLNDQLVDNSTVAPLDSPSFLVPHVPGNLTVSATKQGSAWAVDSIFSTGTPVAIHLGLERPLAGEPVINNGQDAALLFASVVDSEGRVIQSASNKITFTVLQGGAQIAGTGNGDPSDHDPDFGDTRKVWSGFVRAVVKTGRASSSAIIVQASASGLKSATISIPTRPADFENHL